MRKKTLKEEANVKRWNAKDMWLMFLGGLACGLILGVIL